MVVRTLTEFGLNMRRDLVHYQLINIPQESFG